MHTTPLSCASCGAPLDPPGGRTVIECPYCGRALEVQPDSTSVRDGQERESLADQLLRGYDRDFGDGGRHGRGEMAQRDWRAVDRGVWPAEGRASSSFGVGWAAASVVGPPRVYPRHGDRRGAWAPRSRTSRTEWIEAIFPADTPAVARVRVFETNMPGLTFAVTARGPGVGDEEILLWQGAPVPRRHGEAMVLELRVDPPRRVHAVRAYVVNDGAEYTEIDTIGLVAAEPLPAAQRASWPQPGKGRSTRVAVGLLVLAAGMGVFVASSTSHKKRSVAAAPAASVAGATASTWDVDDNGLVAAHVQWASGASASSEYETNRWSAARATGEPNVFPRHGDDPQAWASHASDGGGEWLDVTWSSPVAATGLVVVETFNPGALARIDDLSGAQPVTLWQGTAAPSSSSRVLRVTLPDKREISRLRLVLDTSRVAGWNEIDAVGLLPAW